MWVGIVFCILFSMLLSGIESAILAVSPVRVRHRAKERKPGAILLMKLLEEQRERLLSSVLLVITIVNLAAFAALTTKMVDEFQGLGYGISFLVALPVYVLLIEWLPKSLFKVYPYRMLARFLPVLRGVYFVAAPVILLGAWTVAIFRSREEPFATPDVDPEEHRDELRVIANITEKAGELGATESSMIQSVLDFQQITVREVMLPMANVTSLPANMPLTAAIDLARSTHFSHFPVMDERGELIGLLNIYEALRSPRRHGAVRRFLRRLVPVSTDDSGTSAIRTLRAAGIKIAAVYNPAGQLAGIVTLHDLVDRLIHSSR